jgi:hypothetical protein
MNRKNAARSSCGLIRFMLGGTEKNNENIIQDSQSPWPLRMSSIQPQNSFLAQNHLLEF